MNEINNQMINIKTIIEFFKNKNVYIPLLQRNYKWTEEDATKLAADLWDNYKKNCNKTIKSGDEKNIYTIGMITLYDEENDNIQLIDGQQRIITLTLFLKFLDPETEYFRFEFERDKELEENKKRNYFIEKLLKYEIFEESKEHKLYTDIIRFKNNYRAMVLPLAIRDIEKCVKTINKLETSVNYINDENDKRIVEEDVIQFTKSVGYDENLIKEEINKLNLKSNIYDFINECRKKIFSIKLAERIHELIIANEYMKIEISNIQKIIMQYNNDYSNYNNNYNYYILGNKYNNYINKIKEYIFERLKCIVEINQNLEGNICTKKFIDYILNNVVVLLHVTDSEPIDEFLNINKNKTRFVISDHIKANLIIDTKNDEEKRKNIIELFKHLSMYLYSNDNKDIWELAKHGYECNKDENRLKILFCDRYDGNNKKGYQYEKEYKRLLYYKKILETVKNEISLNLKNQNWNAYNAFCCLYACKQIKFFQMFGKEYDDNIYKMKLEEVIWSKFNLEEMVYAKLKNVKDKNYFLESQLYIEKTEFTIDKNLPEKSKDKWAYILDEKYVDCLNNVIKEYINYKKNTKNITIIL